MSHSLSTLKRWTGLALTAALLSACGGDSVDSQELGTTLNPGGAATFAGAAAAYQGAISGLGSIVVNGVRFETTDALVYDGDDFSTAYDSNAPVFSSPLALGMTVALLGDVDEAQSLGRAARIRVVGGVRGTMRAIDTAALTLTLPTQTVQLSSATTYGGTSDGTASGTAIGSLAQLAALAGNPLLTVYGLPQADGRFLATRVVVTNAQAHAMDVAVRGTITAISGSTYTVQTDANSTITVACSACTIQPTGQAPAVGDAVRALAADLGQWNSPVLTAARLQLLNASYLTTFAGAPSSARYAKIKGVATWDGSRWWVGGVEVSGVPLTAGTLYEIKGTWSGTVLAATRVEVEGQRSFTDSAGSSRSYTHELYGAVSGLVGSRFTVQGVSVDAASAYFEGGSATSLSNGTFVEVKGSYTNGTLQATKVEIKSASSGQAGAGQTFEMYGQVEGWSGVGSAFNLTRSGVTFRAQTSTSTRMKYGAPVNGSYVEVKGYMDTNQVFQILKLEIKDGFDDHDD